jgi:hypothetical protein
LIKREKMSLKNLGAVAERLLAKFHDSKICKNAKQVIEDYSLGVRPYGLQIILPPTSAFLLSSAIKAGRVAVHNADYGIGAVAVLMGSAGIFTSVMTGVLVEMNVRSGRARRHWNSLT